MGTYRNLQRFVQTGRSIAEEISQVRRGLFTFFGTSTENYFRKFYSDQLELIETIESILVPPSAAINDEITAKRKRRDRMIQILTIITLITNIVR